MPISGTMDEPATQTKTRLPAATKEIVVKDLRKQLGDQHVLRGINLSVDRGKTLVLLGRSGGGKSVLLKTLLGLMRADAGSVMICGSEIVGQPEAELRKVRLNIGILFQGAALFDSMSLFDNVAFPLRERNRHIRPAEVQERVMQAVSLVGLEKHVDKLPAALSGGMKKRAGLARAIITQPRCVFYDEPTSGLDPIVSDSINQLITRMQADLGVTSVVVTHDMKSAFQIADTMAFLHEGQIYFQGTTKEWRASEDPLLEDFTEGRAHSIGELG